METINSSFSNCIKQSHCGNFIVTINLDEIVFIEMFSKCITLVIPKGSIGSSMILSQEMLFISDENHGWCQAIDLDKITLVKEYSYITCVDRHLLPNETLIAHNYMSSCTVYIIHHDRGKSPIEVLDPLSGTRPYIILTTDEMVGIFQIILITWQ